MNDNSNSWFPVLPFWGWTAYTPVIPKLYMNCVSTEQEVKNLYKSVDKLEHYANYLAENINKSANETLLQRVNALSMPNFDYFNGYNAVFIGDSFTQGQGSSDYSTTKEKRYSSLVCAALGMTQYNYAVGATGFCNPAGSRNSPFTTQIERAGGEMTEEERENTRLVIIMGGIGDSQTSTEYTYTQEDEAVYQTCVRARYYYPHAMICLYCMPWKGKLYRPKTNNLYNAIVYGGRRSQVAHVCEGCYTWCWGDSSLYASDGVHPNDDGHARIASYVLCSILENKWEMWEDHQYLLTPYDSNIDFWCYSDNPAAPDALPYVYIKRGMVYLGDFAVRFYESISESTPVFTIPASCRPITNQYGGSFVSSSKSGVVTVTPASGIVRVIPDSSISQTAYIKQLAPWPIYGQDYNA